jgi:SHS2 domain-containing protein
MSYASEEHTGEVCLRVEALNLEGLFVEAGRALGEVLGVRRAPTPDAPLERVALHARDRETLLCAWLDELIFCTERSGLIYDVVEIEQLGDGHLLASIRGGSMIEPRTPVKAATLHGLKIEQMHGRLTVRVVLDV